MRVAVGVITDDHNHVLLTKRANAVDHGGYWEFPGGKLEQDETPVQALHRELAEEIGITVLAQEHILQLNHEYPEKCIQMEVFWVKSHTGKPQCLENQQAIRWVSIDSLPGYAFPEANLAIVDCLNFLF